MRQYNKYLVKNTDLFDPMCFPFIDEEIAGIKERIDHLPPTFKKEIMISFLKDHFLQNDWQTANPELSKVVTSGSIFTGAIESLFDSCRQNAIFREHLEIYLAEKFLEADSMQPATI